MADETRKGLEGNHGDCDIRVWCDSCRRSEFRSKSDKYLCASCGKIMVLDHEIGHEHFPHLSGDPENMH